VGTTPIAVVGMAFKGYATKPVLLLFAICLPITFLGTVVGLYLYRKMNDKIFFRASLVASPSRYFPQRKDLPDILR
jgi:hypothetical protein